MSGPISITTIDGSTPIPERHEARLVLEIPLDSFDGPIDPEIGTMLTHIMRDWRDGRYPFEVEQVKNGLHQCIKWACRMLLEQKMQDKYGNEMVVSEDGRSRTAKWHLEASAAKLIYPWMNEEIIARVEVNGEATS